MTVAGEEVAGLADRAYYVGYEVGLPGFLICRLSYRDDLVMGVVEGRADEVVHRCVGDDEGLAAVLLDIEDAGEKSSCLSHDKAAVISSSPHSCFLAGESFTEDSANDSPRLR